MEYNNYALIHTKELRRPGEKKAQATCSGATNKQKRGGRKTDGISLAAKIHHARNGVDPGAAPVLVLCFY
jgi:hypothetical protein